MTALLMAFASFVAWSLIGLGVLAALRVDLGSLRVVLTAPAVGTATMILPLFMLSHAGVSISDCAVPVAIVLVAGSAAAVALRRPRLPLGVVPVMAICVAGLLLAGWPMFDLGFRWISNANDDMANYVLSATRLLHDGLLAPLDIAGLTQNRDFSTAWRVFPAAGARPGADIALAAQSTLTGRPPYEVFMPLIVALNMCAICAVAALALQASRRTEAAFVAAALMAVSPLATFGVVQQLLPQVWGLGIAAALLALVFRPELHRSPGARLEDIVPIGILFAAILLVYIELAATLAAAYLLYVVVLAVRREIDLRAAARLWLSAIAAATILLNTYLFRELDFVYSQTVHGSTSGGTASPFGFALVPGALPGIVGLEVLPTDPNERWLELAIAVTMILLAAAVVASVATAFRGVAAAIALLVYAAIGLVLATKGSDFGVFKLFMYVQPFIAAATAVWLFQLVRKPLFALGAAALAAVVVVQLLTQHSYVNRSLNPVDLPHASAADLLPAFRRMAANARAPLVSVADNPALAKLETAGIGDRSLYLISRNIFTTLLSGNELKRIERADGWEPRSFRLFAARGPRADTFSENIRGSAVLASGRCTIVLPTGSQTVMNRRTLPEGSPNLVSRRCNGAQNVLVFTNSKLGQHFYLYEQRPNVSFYQLERDYFFGGRTLSGLGRYVLFRVLNPSTKVRLELDFTTTLRQDGSNRLPPAVVVGADRTSLPIVGRGSARVFSHPIRPQKIAGQPYVLLDMGIAGRPLPVHRSGIQAAYGRSVILDPRYLTAYVRGISLIADAAYRKRQGPSILSQFPADLANPDLEYSGIYEDGWVAEDSYVMLAGGGRRDLVVRAEVLPHPGQRLQVLVDGRPVATSKVAGGTLGLRVPLPAAPSRRRIELRWAGATPLAAPDLRPAAALLKFIGLVPPRQR